MTVSLFGLEKKTYTTASSIYYIVLELGVYYYKCNIIIKTITLSKKIPPLKPTKVVINAYLFIYF